MSDRPTPRTDAVNCEDGLPIESRYDKMHDLAEELERELAEALEEGEEWFATFRRATKRAGDMREQRDRLTIALERIASGRFDDLACMDLAQQALDEVKGEGS